MRCHLLKPFLLALFCLTVSLHAQPAAAQPSPTNNQDPIASQPFLDNRYLFTDAGQAVAASKGAISSSDVQIGVVRSRHVEIDVGVLTGGRTAGTQAAASATAADERKIVLNLFDDVNLIAVADKLNFTDKGFNWIGKVEGDPKSSVIIAAQDGVCSGNVRYLGKYYEIRYSPAGVHTVKEIDQGQLPDEAPPILQENAPLSGRGDAVPGEDPGAGAAAPLGEGDVALPDAAGQIDVMVIYTPAARVAQGGVAGIESLINLAVLETNQAYANSNISTSLNLVHTEEAVGYVESSFEADLDRLTSPYDGYLDYVHTLRDVYGADLVSLVRGGSLTYCGIGWILQVVDPLYSENIGFSVTHEYCATGNYTFGHELGHNQGCRHEPANAGSAGAYPYSYGYQEPSWNFRTVMAYDCPVAGGCPRIQHFSNPTVDYFGQPTGLANADNALTIDNTAIAVANYRESTYAGQIPAMQSPTPGSTIADPNQVFTWTTTSVVDSHWIQIGAAPAGNEIFNSGELFLATSVQASGLPQDGSSIYVRLWYQINGVWGFIDYVYDTYLAPPDPGQIQSPAPGSTLTASPVTFSWSTGTGVSQYWFTLGSAPGGADLVNQGTSNATSITAAVPLTGNPVYAQVISRIDGVWVPGTTVQYSTIFVPSGEAVIQNPPPGSTISTNPVTISWDPGSGALQYWFIAGTTPGGSDLANVGTGLSTSRTLNVPLNGSPIYAEVFTQLSSGWSSAGSVQYNTANLVSQINSPSPGTTINNSPVSFGWTNTPGVLEYWFVLGTTPGGAELVSKSAGTSTSVSVDLALNGATVYAQVFANIGPTWVSSDIVSFQTSSSISQINSPAPGSLLSNSPVVFGWTSTPGATQYWFTLGSYPGGADLANLNGYTNNSLNVNVNLSGADVYAQLYVKIGTIWSTSGPVQYSTLNKPNGPGIVQTPAPGSTLTTSPVTFTWDPGQGVLQHWVILGTTPGGGEIYSAGHGTDTQATINVPLTGNPVYFQIWSNVAGTWMSDGPVTYQTQ